MSLLKRFRSSVRGASAVNSEPAPNRPAESSPSSVMVPAGHQVTLCPLAPEPEVRRLSGGTVIVQLGTSSDEFLEEFQMVSERLDDLLACQGPAPAPVLLAVNCHQISDLFAPNDVETVALPGLVLWVIDASSAPLWLRAPEHLLAALRHTAACWGSDGLIQQHVLLNVEQRPVGTGDAIGRGETPVAHSPPGTEELVHLLTDAQVAVNAVPDDGLFFVEVCRPDATIGALRMAPLAKEGMAYRQEGQRPIPSVARAPRLCRLTLAAITRADRRNRHQLFEELLSRDIALLVISDREGRVTLRTWADHRSALPVYPDLTSLFQATDDVGIDRAFLAWASFTPGELFAWASQALRASIALNVYKDRDTPLYFFLTEREISDLAHGRRPD